MIQYSKEHDEWLKKKAKDLSLRITNNKKNMTSTQKRLSGFVPNRTPRTATENYQITKSQKDTFRDKVYTLFNNDQKLTNIFVGMYEEFYKDDDEMYVYFNITYNDLVKAFKGVVTRPSTVLRTHEKLLNKFKILVMIVKMMINKPFLIVLILVIPHMILLDHMLHKNPYITMFLHRQCL
jgi:hypothetical protein